MSAKPSKLARAVAKWEAKRAKETEAQRAKKLALARWAVTSACVKRRDGGQCRVCGQATFSMGDPRKIGAAHHIVYRSAGGADTLANLVWACATCHEAEHAHRISITGTSDNLVVRGTP